MERTKIIEGVYDKVLPPPLKEMKEFMCECHHTNISSSEEWDQEASAVEML